MQTARIRRMYETGLNGPKEQPNYFVTWVFDPAEDEPATEATADLLGIKVVWVNKALEKNEVVWSWDQK